MLPFGIIYLLNWVIFITIFVKLLLKKTVKKSLDKKKEAKTKLRQQFIIALTLSLLFGLGWGFGFAITTSIGVDWIVITLQAFFIILTSFQGLLIFVMQCARSEDARKEWQRWVRAVTCNKVTFDLLTKKKKGTSVTSGEFGYRTKGTTAGLGTLSTSINPNSDTLKKMVKKDLESSTFAEESTFVSSTLESIEEVEKKDLSLNKEEKVKYELLSQSQDEDSSPDDQDSPTRAAALPTILPTLKEEIAEDSPPEQSSPVTRDDSALLSDVNIRDQDIELAALDPIVEFKPDPKDGTFPSEFDIVMVNRDAKASEEREKKQSKAASPPPKDQMGLDMDGLFGTSETSFL